MNIIELIKKSINFLNKSNDRKTGATDTDINWTHDTAFRIRIITALSLLVLVLVFKLFMGYPLPLMQIIIIVAIESLLNQPYLFIRKKISLKKLFYFNTSLDIILITFFIYFIGSTDVAFFIAIYLLAIAFSSMVLSVRTGVWLASLSTILYTGLIALEHFHVIPHVAIIGAGMTDAQKILLVVSSFLFFYLFALFPGYSLTMLNKKISEIKEAKNIAQNILESIADGMIILNVEGTIISVNKALVKQLGYLKKELIGKTVADTILPQKEIKRSFSDLKTLFKGKKLNSYEYIIKCKSGREFPASISASVLRDEQNRPASIIVVIRDITETKELIANIKNSENKLLEKVNELEKFNKLTVGRELKMIELKKTIKEMEEKLKFNS